MSSKRVGDLTASPYNPRRIDDAHLALLAGSMERYGDLSGIVVNRRTGHVVGGHQRIKHIDPGTPIHVTGEFDPPTETGTVALGYVEHAGERWSYREVDWGEEDEAVANIGANQHGGTFVKNEVADILSELDANGFEDLGLAGFTESELESMLVGDEEAAPQDTTTVSVKVALEHARVVVEAIEEAMKVLDLPYHARAA